MIPERMPDSDTNIFDAIRSNKMNFNEYQEYLEERCIEAWEDGYGAGWLAHQAYRDFEESSNG